MQGCGRTDTVRVDNEDDDGDVPGGVDMDLAVQL